MASRLFRRLSDELIIAKGQQVRWGHKVRGKPPGVARTLAQRLEEMNRKDPEISFRVNIGYKQPVMLRSKVMSAWIDETKKRRADPELERKARNAELRIDLDKAKEDWWNMMAPTQLRTIADHYGIFEHLFGDAYFTPVVPLHVDYDLGNDLLAKVYRGNLLKPSDTTKAPTVNYVSKPDTLWTLLCTTPDCNFVNSDNELCHWFIGNIPGNEISKGDLLVDYLRPIPAKGIGYCRYIFVLYKQEKRIDYSEYMKEQPCLQLVERDWNTLNFYRKYQDLLTPAGLSFFQADWDESLTKFYHDTLNTQEPIFEYDFPAPYIAKPVWFPKGKPFNLYLDKYRDPKDINKDFLLKKMKNVHPFRPSPPPLKFPNAHPMPKDAPSWLRLEIKKERLGWGRINEIK